jgi:hypothetical protein
MMSDETRAEMIVDAIIEDLEDRAKPGTQWYGSDPDAEEEIRLEWQRIILDILA